MGLSAGARLGPYEVVGVLGAGGMGEVYRAKDTRLERPVAIKVLSQAVTDGPQALERFHREARSASALNHPNICTVYDVGSDPPFLAMELLEGETIQQRLTRGPMEVAALVDAALAVSDALEAAHVRGIIHRDIKTSNIFLTDHGPKLLDFGLAKMAVATRAVSRSCEPTRPGDAMVTDPGQTVGTVAYMSPEQLRGEVLDARTDLFSFGLVLYEMATGRPAFAGATSAIISAAILHAQPVAPGQIRPGLPPQLAGIILKALEKDRDVRYQHASELRADLKRLKREIASHPSRSVAARKESAAVTGSTVATAKSTLESDSQVVIALIKRHRVRVALGAAVLAGSMAGGLYLLRSRPPRRAPADLPVSLADLQIVQLTTSGLAERPAISPDGKYVAYIQRDDADTGLWIRQVATGSNVQIMPPEPNVELEGVTVTPDGSFIDVVREFPAQGRQLWRIPFLGGTPRRVIDDVDSPVGWAPDGRHLAFVRSDHVRGRTELVIADPDGRNERVLEARQSPEALITLSLAGRPPNAPSWSTDGRAVAVLGYSRAGSNQGRGELVIADVSTGAARVVMFSGSSVFDTGVAWLDPGSLIVNHAGEFGAPHQLWRLSLTSQQLTRLSNDLNSYDGLSATAGADALATGRRETRVGVWVGDSSGDQIEETVRPAPFGPFLSTATLAWAGDRLLYMTTIAGRQGVASIVPGHGHAQEVVSPAGLVAATSDGRTIVIDRDGLWKADSDGRHAVQLTNDGFVPTVTPDDRSVLFLSTRTGLQAPWMVPLDGGTSRQIVNIPVAVLTLDVSPDGRWLVLVSLERQNQRTLAICDFPRCTTRRTLGRPGMGRVRFAPDGLAVAYVDPTTRSNIWLQPLDGRPPRQLTRFNADRTITDFAWSRGGQRLAIARATIANDIVLFKGLKP